jgi:hypothetical protein
MYIKIVFCLLEIQRLMNNNYANVRTENNTAACLDAEEAAAIQIRNSSDFQTIMYGDCHNLY